MLIRHIFTCYNQCEKESNDFFKILSTLQCYYPLKSDPIWSHFSIWAPKGNPPNPFHYNDKTCRSQHKKIGKLFCSTSVSCLFIWKVIGSIFTHIRNDCKLGQHVQNLEPNSNVFSSFGYSSSGFTNKLLCIQTNFNPIVEQGKEWGKWKSCHKNGNKSKLKHWKKEKNTVIWI